jgi:hypothetical protein
MRLFRPTSSRRAYGPGWRRSYRTILEGLFISEIPAIAPKARRARSDFTPSGFTHDYLPGCLSGRVFALPSEGAGEAVDQFEQVGGLRRGEVADDRILSSRASHRFPALIATDLPAALGHIQWSAVVAARAWQRGQVSVASSSPSETEQPRSVRPKDWCERTQRLVVNRPRSTYSHLPVRGSHPMSRTG